ncbi:MAG: hypothetical protein WAN70_11660 [Terriglobales bacterium]
MNPTSAEDRGGRTARVDDGSVLLGAPGAPGCTTTGFAGSVCCAQVAGEMKTMETPAASNVRMKATCVEPVGDWILCDPSFVAEVSDTVGNYSR